MGTFVHPLTLRRDGKEVTLDAPVDAGSKFTSVPGYFLLELGVQPIATIGVRLASKQLVTVEALWVGKHA